MFQKKNSEIDEAKSYYLLLDQDINTHGYTNWFFFRVRNEAPGLRKFYLLNMAKKTNFYKQNMKISVFSKKKLEKEGKQWFKGGSNISFFQTNFMRSSDPLSYSFCLYFEYNFEDWED